MRLKAENEVLEIISFLLARSTLCIVRKLTLGYERCSVPEKSLVWAKGIQWHAYNGLRRYVMTGYC